MYGTMVYCLIMTKQNILNRLNKLMYNVIIIPYTRITTMYIYYC